MLKRICFILLFVVVQQTVFADACDTLESVNWLVGNWHSENSKLRINESWKRVSAKTLEGYGQTESVEKNKIVSAETLGTYIRVYPKPWLPVGEAAMIKWCGRKHFTSYWAKSLSLLLGMV